MAASVCACNPGRVFQERVSLAPDMVWDMDNVLQFEPVVSDPDSFFDVNIDLRTVDFYPNSNMWLYIRTESPSGNVRVDTLECILRDEKGFSNSTSRMAFGEVEDYEIPFQQNVKFPEPGKYKFSIQHGMRMEKLPFVNEVGLIIQKHDQ